MLLKAFAVISARDLSRVSHLFSSFFIFLFFFSPCVCNVMSRPVLQFFCLNSEWFTRYGLRGLRIRFSAGLARMCTDEISLVAKSRILFLGLVLTKKIQRVVSLPFFFGRKKTSPDFNLRRSPTSECLRRGKPSACSIFAPECPQPSSTSDGSGVLPFASVFRAAHRCPRRYCAI